MKNPAFDQLRHVLFDAVGTVIFPNPDVISVYHDFGLAIKSRKSRDEIKRDFAGSYRSEFENAQVNSTTRETVERERWQRVVIEVFDDVFVDEQQFNRLWQHFEDPTHWSIYPDVIDAWNSLTERGLKLGIASNFDARLRKICTSHLPSCQELFISTELGWSKPHLKFFEAIQTKLSARPEEILIVGDSYRNDIAPATECGWHAIQIDRDTAESKPGVINELSDVVSLIRR